MKLYIPKHHFMLYKVKIDALISKKNGHTRINKTLESRILDYTAVGWFAMPANASCDILYIILT